MKKTHATRETVASLLKTTPLQPRPCTRPAFHTGAMVTGSSPDAQPWWRWCQAQGSGSQSERAGAEAGSAGAFCSSWFYVGRWLFFFLFKRFVVTRHQACWKLSCSPHRLCPCRTCSPLQGLKDSTVASTLVSMQSHSPRTTSPPLPRGMFRREGSMLHKHRGLGSL